MTAPTCPNCQSVETVRVGPGLLGFGSLVLGSCLLWIPVIGWVLAPIFLALAVVFWIWSLIPGGRISFQCQGCKAWFTVRKRDLADPQR